MASQPRDASQRKHLLAVHKAPPDFVFFMLAFPTKGILLLLGVRFRLLAKQWMAWF